MVKEKKPHLKTAFSLSGNDYAFEILRGNEIIFYLEYSRGNDLLTDDFGYHSSAVRTVNSINSSVAVFAKVRRLLLDYILGNRVAHFCFKAGLDRIEIYRKFAASLESYGYHYCLHEGQFTFYRMVES